MGRGGDKPTVDAWSGVVVLDRKCRERVYQSVTVGCAQNAWVTEQFCCLRWILLALGPGNKRVCEGNSICYLLIQTDSAFQQTCLGNRHAFRPTCLQFDFKESNAESCLLLPWKHTIGRKQKDRLERLPHWKHPFLTVWRFEWKA